MTPFRLAFTGDYLNEQACVAYGNVGLDLIDGHPTVRYHFLKDQAPRQNDPSYWQRLYSLLVTPEHIRDINGLVLLRPRVNRTTFANGANSLVVIGRSGAGYDKVDLEACTENDVLVFNSPMALNHSTASSALMFMLALAKRLPQQDRITRAGRWDLQAAEMESEIQGRILGIVGLGHSGRELVRLVAPFSMRIIAYSPSADPEQARSLGVTLTSLETVCREADFISLHCRLKDQTRRMIRAEHLAMMKPTAFLINIARGEVIDQSALVATLRERRIAGAALDVFETEPVPAGDPILELDNVILAPHWSCSTADVWRATGRSTIERMLQIARGEIPEHVINPKVLDRRGFRDKLARVAGR